MSANRQNLEISRGDAVTYCLEVEDDDQVDVDITGSTIWFTVKEDADDTDAAALIQLSSADIAEIDIYSPTIGRARIYVKNAHTQNIAIGRHIYDVQIKTAAGDPYTVVLGAFTVLADVTRTI